ncbi:MAG: bifunctional 5,10-methylene-tetrahydrofolate dehydrogenase/5,10-methylene-tetrahydrofolate cyclohydrolase [Deltaproteobacteria bacterium CG2_30_63_29]|nr:MAG: bifunctional 5,10-methylene-tetrahydrofolate dehydrogenase/5,10-methylene-tetrahydrofolate cyclohydrolase [Deltaproteobacteria bacterium CG2_30_63_29]PJB35419.1 MAG: bifunctional methylenetetrahydrofolate dehydrogenase/methenyltetrahydrofolate cyclohydrolase FolD [Deltaproteobacteria bacterium CG_4_9_14_3_um_filter_63_12]
MTLRDQRTKDGARLLSGLDCSAAIKAELELELDALSAAGKPVPQLVVVRVGADPASASYVKSKRKAAAAVGIRTEEYHLDASITPGDLTALIDRLNADDDVDGILLQLPLPSHLDDKLFLNQIRPDKDVDGFHPMNMGHMLTGSNPLLLPCTPRGIMELMTRYGVTFSGKKAVVIGRSNIVGKPVAVLLTQANATVTLCHSRTASLEAEVRGADLLIAAVGVPHLVKGEWLKEGAVVVDAGINRLESGKLVGDVDFDAAQAHASAITPVPGGVGPMTVTMLILQTLIAAKARRNL